MRALVIVLLFLPVVLAVGAGVRRDLAPTVSRLGGLAVAAGWAVVALAASPDRLAFAGAAAAPLEVGALRFDAVAAAAAAGVALLLAAYPPRSLIGVSGGLTSVTLLAVASTANDASLPDRSFAAGVVLVAALSVARLVVERMGSVASLSTGIAGLALVASLGTDDAPLAAALALSATAILVVIPLVLGHWPSVLLPVGLLAAVRACAATGVAELFGTGSERVAILGAGVGVSSAVVQLLMRRHRPVVDRLPLAAVSAALVLLSQDVRELHQAGVVLAAGAVLALAGRHVVGLVACVPGLMAAVDAASIATEPVHAAAAASVVAVLVAAAVEAPGTPRQLGPLRWPLVPAVAFGLLPVAGFAEVELETMGPTLLALVSLGACAVAVALVPVVRAARASEPGG